MWNKELYVREQQDAYEFFTSLIDQMDEYLKVKTSVISCLVYMHLLGTFSLFLLCSSEKKAESHSAYFIIYIVFRSLKFLLLSWSFTLQYIQLMFNFTSPTENRKRPNI